ncbi:telomeric repeat-binding factor 2-interacting protein 1 [Patella vulgata]|uniref:telomeric repeat-binding factor 2-interacting protein 1 n=1 Tax=Patella vulgata TaxID=6465 RepID=UPI00217F90E7|nr:telomeric repeat-binding factor 2-interacting protein 1 [Patella vulgata]
MAASSFCKHKYSKKLFKDENGQSLLFVMRPCKERQRIAAMIEYGGGEIKSKEVEGRTCIRLAEKDSCTSGGDYISTKYITDCCEADTLLDQKKYRLNPFFDADLEHAPVIMSVPPSKLKGRKKYTEDEDLSIITYIIKKRQYNNVSGIILWKDMVMLKVTDHSYQSMRERYLKYILPNIDRYKIANSWKSLLTGNTKKALNSSSSFSSDSLDEGIQSLANLASKVKSPATNSDRKKTTDSQNKSPLKKPDTATSKSLVENVKKTPETSRAPVVSSTPKNGSGVQNELNVNAEILSDDSNFPEPQDAIKLRPLTFSSSQSELEDNNSKKSDSFDSEDEFDRNLYKLTEMSSKENSPQKRQNQEIDDGEPVEKSPRKTINSSPENVTYESSEESPQEKKKSVPSKRLEFITTRKVSALRKAKSGSDENASDSASPKKRPNTRSNMSPTKSPVSNKLETSPTKKKTRAGNKPSTSIDITTSNLSPSKKKMPENKATTSADSPADSPVNKTTRSSSLTNKSVKTGDSSPIKKTLPANSSPSKKKTSPTKYSIAQHPTPMRNNNNSTSPHKQTKSTNVSPVKQTTSKNISPVKQTMNNDKDTSLVTKRIVRTRSTSILLPTSSKNEKSERNHRAGSRNDLKSFIMDELSCDSPTDDGDDDSDEYDQVLEDVVGEFKMKYDLPREETLQILWTNSGRVRDAIHYIEYGGDTNWLPGWGRHDDDLLSSSKEEDIKKLTRKFGVDEVHKRCLFLEDLNK